MPPVIGARPDGILCLLSLGLATMFTMGSVQASQGFSIAAGQSCVTPACHADNATKEFVHETASNGSSCDTCHEIVEEGRHEFRLIAEDAELCLVCHDGVAGRLHEHAPLTAGQCTVCHDPHQSDNPSQLEWPLGEICLECHDQATSGERVTHGPVAEGRCTECHDPHGSDQPAQLVAPVPGLCVRCHDRALEDQQGRPLAPSRPADDGAPAHAPFATGDCLACHVPHASENYRLLVEPLPEAIYASFAVDRYLCLNCHDEMAFLDARTTTATAFRNGNLNLHHRHVNRPKGRTCRTCHEHHHSEREMLIRTRAPADARFINILEFARSETGGTCAPTCHKALSYDRYDPVQHGLKVTPREGVEATPEELVRSRHRKAEGGEINE